MELTEKQQTAVNNHILASRELIQAFNNKIRGNMGVRFEMKYGETYRKCANMGIPGFPKIKRKYSY